MVTVQWSQCDSRENEVAMDWETKDQTTMENSTLEVELAQSCFTGAYWNINRHSLSPDWWRPINLQGYLRGIEQETKAGGTVLLWEFSGCQRVAHGFCDQ